MPGFELIGKEEQILISKIFQNGSILSRHGFDHLRNNIFMVNEFEKNFAEKLKTSYSLAVTSGTAALKVALKALNIKPGEEIITQCHTFVATVEAILDCGAKPVITEINETLNMDPDDLESKITEKTKAIIPVHMLGVSCQMDQIMNIANKYQIPVIEDTAQALGGLYKEKYLGTIGKIGTFSFDFAKALTTGEGGMIITDDEQIYLNAKEYHDHGHENNPNFPRGKDTRKISGFNYRMMEIQAAIGLAQLEKLNIALLKQKKNKDFIKSALIDCKNISFRKIPLQVVDTCDSLIFFLKTVNEAKLVSKELTKKGIGTKNLPDAINWHFSGTWNHIFKNADQLWKTSEGILKKAIALPIWINMDKTQLEELVENLLIVIK